AGGPPREPWSRCCATPAQPRSTSGCPRRPTPGPASTASTHPTGKACSPLSARCPRSASTSVWTRSPTSPSTSWSGPSTPPGLGSAALVSPASTRWRSRPPPAGRSSRLPSGPDQAGPGGRGLTYADTGVDIGAGDEAVERIKDVVRTTYRPEVVGDLGGFGGLFALATERYRQP